MNRAVVLRSAIILLSALAIFFSLPRLTESPPVWYDEGWYVQTAANLAQTGETGLQLAPGHIEHVAAQTTVSYPLIAPLAGVLYLWGSSILHARALMAAFILGFLAAACWFARRMWGTDMSLGALALLATLPTLYGNGKSVLGEVPGLFYLAIFLAFFHMAAMNPAHKRRSIVLAALFAGLCVATKPLYIVLLPAIGVAAVFMLRRRELGWVDVLWAAVAGLIPILGWVWFQFAGGSGSLSSILGYYANPYGIQDLSSVILTNLKQLFADMSTLYVTIPMVLWLAAICMRIRLRQRIAAAEICALIFCMLVVGAFLRTAGWYRYLFPAQVVALVFLPSALVSLAERIPWRNNAVVRWSVPAVIAVLAVASAYQTGFRSWVADAYASHRTADWQAYMSTVSPSTTIFFYNVPEVAIFDPYRNYYQFLHPAGIELGADGLGLIRAGSVDRIIVQTDALAGDGATLFSRYRVAQTLDKYSILTLSR